MFHLQGTGENGKAFCMTDNGACTAYRWSELHEADYVGLGNYLSSHR